MAIRSRQIYPDQTLTTVRFGAFPVISREALAEALIDAAAFVDFAGGTVTLVVERHPTDAPDEMVTIRAMVQWRDTTYAKPDPEPAAELDEPEDPGEEEEPPQVEVLPFTHPDDPDAAGLEDEDLSEIPAGMR